MARSTAADDRRRPDRPGGGLLWLWLLLAAVLLTIAFWAVASILEDRSLPDGVVGTAPAAVPEGLSQHQDGRR